MLVTVVSATNVDFIMSSYPFRSVTESGTSFALRPQRSLADRLDVRGSAEPIVVLPDPSEDEIDAALLIRLGDRVPAARQARAVLGHFLVHQLGALVKAQTARFAITTMPERCNARVEHTFVSFVRQLARDLGIESINRRFRETRPRSDVSDLPHHQRRHSLEDVWVYEGRLDGRVVILVDDVVDTGLSLRTAGRILTKAGAAVLPLALIRMHNENSEMERTIRKHFGNECRALLELAEVQGSLRCLIESCSRDPAQHQRSDGHPGHDLQLGDSAMDAGVRLR